MMLSVSILNPFFVDIYLLYRALWLNVSKVIRNNFQKKKYVTLQGADVLKLHVKVKSFNMQKDLNINERLKILTRVDCYSGVNHFLIQATGIHLLYR